jgi:hypothetical protein
MCAARIRVAEKFKPRLSSDTLDLVITTSGFASGKIRTVRTLEGREDLRLLNRFLETRFSGK